MRIRELAVALWLFLAAACADPCRRFDEDVLYSFFVAGHTYGKPLVDNEGLHPPFKKRFDLVRRDEKIELGVLTGDVVIAGTPKNWDEVDRDLERLGKRVVVAVGNHDMTNRKLFEERYGPTYSSFELHGDRFLVLDPNLDSWNISGEQLEWLRRELAAAREAPAARNVFVFFHQLLWWEREGEFSRVRPNSLQGRGESVNFWAELMPLFRAVGQPVYLFAGDLGAFPEHRPYYHRDGNLTFVAGGMGGGVHDHFVIVDVSREKRVSFRLIALNTFRTGALGCLENY